LVHPGAPWCSPVRQTRAAFGFLAPFYLNPFFTYIFALVCVGINHQKAGD
jgi:hypothetical protein